VKGFNARAALISLLLGFTMVTQGRAEDYYIYQTPNGAVVITNKEPPPGSKITKRISFPDATDNEDSQSQQSNNPQPKRPLDSSPKTSKGK
jgi:hypothetical protein